MIWIFTSNGAEDCSAKKSKEKVKNRRKVVRHLRKKYIDNIEDKEGVSYKAGGF